MDGRFKCGQSILWIFIVFQGANDMVSKYRKVQESGNSYIITLPKGWCKRNGIGNGDTVMADEIGDGSVLEIQKVR